MAVDTKKDVIQSVRARRYLNKSFAGLRQDIVEYARTYYDDKIRDFSESGLGGVLIDFAAFVGDNLSFYLDHQFSELSSEDAVENQNIERSLRSADVKITGASPAVVLCEFSIEVPAEPDGFGGKRVQTSALPILQEGTTCIADNGTEFVLLDDLDFSERNKLGDLKATVRFADVLSDGSPATYVVTAVGVCMSGFRTQESFAIGSDFVQFREVSLSNPNVTEIMKVSDDIGNTYYEVERHTQDVVYSRVPNVNDDGDVVTDVLMLTPAPYRYVRKTSTSSRTTTLVFGGGSADTLEDDAIPDPTDFALPLYGKRTFTRTSIDPETLLNTRTLGVAGTNTTLTVAYQHGGGLSHNVAAGTISAIPTVKMVFPNGPSAALASRVRNSVDVRNPFRASGGEDPPTTDELKLLIPAARSAQSRIVTRPDILARIYTLPSNFGRVFRAGIRSSSNNPLVTELYVISRDEDGRLITSPDTLKKNLVTYLNTYRMISDAIDIYDGKIIDLQLRFRVTVEPGMNKNLVLQSVLTKLKRFFDVKNFTIDKPIVLSDVHNIIFYTSGVVSVNQIKFVSAAGVVGSNTYSDFSFDVDSNTKHDMLIPPPGGMFEVRFPDIDLVGIAT